MPDSTPQQPKVRRPVHRRPSAWIVAAALLIVLGLGGRFAWQEATRPLPPIVIAIEDSLSGPNVVAGPEARAATQLYINEVNAAGGIDGHLIDLQAYDDRSTSAKAHADVATILASEAVAVLGRSSKTSIETSPLYRDGHIAMVAGDATADDLTRDNPYFFRTVSTNGAQAEFLANYIRSVVLPHTSAFLRPPDIDLVGGAGTFASDFLAGFQRPDTGLKPNIFMLADSADLDASARTLADQLAREPDPRIIVLGLAKDEAAATLKAMRRRGIRSLVIVASSAATEGFVRQFDAEPEEKDEPGFFTDNLFAVAPIILDNAGLLGQGMARGYRSGTGVRAGWYAAGAQDAARVLVEAIRRAHIGNTPATRADDRKKIRNALAAINSEANAVSGVIGPLYFNPAREMPRPMQYGYFHEGRFLSAPLQLVPVKDRDLVDIDREIALGHMVQIGDKFFWLQRVVSTGIDLARLSRVDTKEGTFNADFYFWLRYAGSDDLPSQIEFSDFSGSFDAARPLRSSVENGINYRLWHLAGNFKTNFNLHDYPFDTQALVIRMRNREYPREQIVYAIDTSGLQLDESGRTSGNSDAFADLQLWRVVTVAPFVASFSIRSTLGEPALFGTSNRTEYGSFTLAVVVQRNVLAFMVKALLPLFLLVLVVFATLFFPPSMAKERLTIPVTGILTSAVLLISITNQLPPLGYTVALEYVFFVFFLLCLTAMITGLLSETLRNKTFHRHVIKVDMFGRFAYVAIAAVTIGVYLWKYGRTMI
jgi:ABC-type branched-subunit amino acid transport system substrate-binding protein